jgi:hypothetical protein
MADKAAKQLGKELLPAALFLLQDTGRKLTKVHLSFHLLLHPG